MDFICNICDLSGCQWLSLSLSHTKILEPTQLLPALSQLTTNYPREGKQHAFQESLQQAYQESMRREYYTSVNWEDIVAQPPQWITDEPEVIEN